MTEPMTDAFRDLSNSLRLPWSVDVDPRPDGVDQILDADNLTVAFMSTPAEQSYGNARAIVAFVNAMPSLLSEIDRLTRALAEMTAERDAIRDGSFCTKCGWNGVPNVTMGGGGTGQPIVLAWHCGNDSCGYEVHEPKSATVDRLTRALTEATRERDEANLQANLRSDELNEWRDSALDLTEARDALITELSEANEKIARLTEEMERDRRIVAAHAKCDPKDCTVIVGLSIVHGHMPTEPHAALTTPTEEKANG